LFGDNPVKETECGPPFPVQGRLVRRLRLSSLEGSTPPPAQAPELQKKRYTSEKI